MASILAVDDSASMRQMVAFTLKGAGYEVVEAVDGLHRRHRNLAASPIPPMMTGFPPSAELPNVPSCRSTSRLSYSPSIAMKFASRNLLVAAWWLFTTTAVWAAERTGEQVYRELCTSCHGMTNTIVGPAFQDVAKKYTGRADAVEYLSAKIRKGGQGVWGSIPMPEQSQLNESDARLIAGWLAGGAK